MYGEELDPESTPVSMLNRALEGLEDGVAFRARGSLGHEEATFVGETLGDQADVFRGRGEPYSEVEHGQAYAMRKLDKIE